MAQRKKKNATNKKAKTTNKKTKQTTILQSIPYYGSSQLIGHQYNKNKVSFVPQQHETMTDNVVGELVGRLMNKIDNDENKQTQQYTKEIQPTNNNNNSNVVNIYNDGTKKQEKQPDEKPPEEKTKEIINNAGRSAGEDFGIQTGAGMAALLGIGGLGVAYNSEAAGKAKLKLKKAGTGILGAVTSGVGAIGTAINNNVLKRGNKLGGEVGEKLYEKKGKAGYQKLNDEPNPLQADFDKFIGEVKPSSIKSVDSPKTSSIKPAETPTPTPIKRQTQEINLFTPSKSLLKFKPQNMLSPVATPLNLLTSPKPVYIEPIERTLEKMNAGDKIKAAIKRRNVQRDMQDVNNEVSKIQRVYKSKIAREELNKRKEAVSTIQRARPSGIQQHDGVSTRSIRAQTGEPHTQMPRQYFNSDHPEYRRGQRARESDGARFRPLVEVLNPDNAYNQGYFGEALQKGKEGYHAREVKKGRPKSSMLSQAGTEAALTPRAATAPTPKKK